MKGVAFFLVVLAVLTLVATPGEAISCGEVQSSLAPCISFVAGTESEPNPSCCAGVKNLSGLQSKEDRQTACNCIKSASSGYNMDSGAASSLPGKCGVSVGATFSPDMDCSQF